MDLEVIGRHALFFDDDAAAGFVNSTDALVEWHSLLIDRYDVRHLLSSPPPPRPKRRQANPDAHDSLESQLDHERYQDLPLESPSTSDQDDDDGVPLSAGGYRAVSFSYGNTSASTDQKGTENESCFRPPFTVPEELQILPPTEKVHQIMARTAMYVSKQGGQSEIVLRVKQGGNPAFGFLMPDHPLHPYFRFLVDHQELLSGNSLGENTNGEGGLNQTGGALSILGTTYGTGEDEDPVSEAAIKHKDDEADKAGNTSKATTSNGSEGCSDNSAEKEESTTKNSLSFLKEKSPIVKSNPSVSTVKIGGTSKMKKEGDILHLAPAIKSQDSTLLSPPIIESPVVEPPSELKRVIEKIVEFILRNGKQFEAVLAEQDVKHGRFPFLLSSNLHHTYYRTVLQKAEEAKISGKGSIFENQDKKAMVSRESISPFTGSDIPDDSSRKEKFKMVIPKQKKESQEPVIQAPQQHISVNVDAEAAAAILQAATRGIKHPNLGILSMNGTSQGPSSEGGQASSFGSFIQKAGQSAKQIPGVSVPVANAIAKTAAIVADGEADSCEASLTREQKLKAERLKRAKMFAAMLKGKAIPLKSERGLSVEPPDSGASGSVAIATNLVLKEREGSSAPCNISTFDKKEKAEGDGFNERRLKRRYRSKTSKYEEEDDDEEDNEEVRDHKRSRRKHRSSHRSEEKRKHSKKHSSSKDIDSHGKRRHDDSSSGDENRRSRHRHRNQKSSNKHENDNYSSDYEQRHNSRSHKHKKASCSEKEADLEEGEICSKPEPPKAIGSEATRESFVEQSTGRGEISDELRAKIRAMLMATL